MMLNEEIMEKVNKFEYLGLTPCKHGGTNGETWEKAMQGRNMVESLSRMTKWRQKCYSKNSIIITLRYAHGTMTCNQCKPSYEFS